MAITITQEIYDFDLDQNGNIKTSSIMHFLQQAATADSNQYGLTYEFMKSHDQVFVLIKSSIEFYQPIKKYDVLSYESWAYSMKGATFERCYSVKCNGREVASCRTYWALISFSERKILRPSLLVGEIPCFPDKICTAAAPSRFKWADEPVEIDRRKVYGSYIDQNKHLNNCAYGDIISDYLSDNRLKAFEIHYVEEAFENDLLSIRKGLTEQGKLLFSGYNLTQNRPCFEAVVGIEEN